MADQVIAEVTTEVIPEDVASRPEAGSESEPAEGAIQLQYRGATEKDINFILNSWLVSFRKSKRWTNDGIYWKKQQRLIASLASHATVIICCDQEKPEYVIGWICGEHIGSELRVHYVYVKQGYRDLGIGRELLKLMGWRVGRQIIASHSTPAMRGMKERFHVIYDEYVLTEGNHP